MEEIKEISDWIDENCDDGEIAYILPHGSSYNPDVFRNVYLPDMSLRNKIPYGSAVLGTHKFPTELFHSKYVLTCSPFPDGWKLALKYNDLFLANNDKFELVKTFDMNNGVVFYAYERKEPADSAEIDYYINALSEEDEKFPDLFSDVINQYKAEHSID